MKTRRAGKTNSKRGFALILLALKIEEETNKPKNLDSKNDHILAANWETEIPDL